MKKRIGFLVLIGIFILYVVLTYIFKLENCLVQLIIGIPCPGCGMTRAFFACLRFDFIEALRLNPIIFLLPIIVIIVLLREKCFFKTIYKSNLFWGLMLLITISIYIARMIMYFPNEPMNYYDDNLFNIIISWLKSILQLR